MGKKIFIGITIGALLGISIPVLIRFKKENDLFSDEDLSDENQKSGNAHEYLLSAKKKSEKLLNEAKIKSDSILERASEILNLAKEKTSAIHYDIKDAAEKEVLKIKQEIDEAIAGYKKEIGLK